MGQEKCCVKCKRVKLIANFVKRNDHLDGFSNICDKCRHQRETNYNRLNEDRAVLQKRRWLYTKKFGKEYENDKEMGKHIKNLYSL